MDEADKPDARRLALEVRLEALNVALGREGVVPPRQCQPHHVLDRARPAWCGHVVALIKAGCKPTRCRSRRCLVVRRLRQVPLLVDVERRRALNLVRHALVATPQEKINRTGEERRYGVPGTSIRATSPG